jgi:hypothetical protein
MCVFVRQLGTTEECFNYTIRRWYPVANMTKTRSARIFGTYEPEKFNVTMFYPTPLYALDICAVCGSYQCPYCPYYSGSGLLSPTVLTFVVVILASVLNVFGILRPFEVR